MTSDEYPYLAQLSVPDRLRLAAKFYPHLQAGVWYHVWDMGADDFGMYLDLDGAARYVFRHHFEVET